MPPASCINKSVVEVESWPTTFKVPQQCKDRFEFDDKRIMFKGMMTESQKNALLENVEAKHKVEELFTQSRLIHEETTL